MTKVHLTPKKKSVTEFITKKDSTAESEVVHSLSNSPQQWKLKQLVGAVDNSYTVLQRNRTGDGKKENKTKQKGDKKLTEKEKLAYIQEVSKKKIEELQNAQLPGYGSQKPIDISAPQNTQIYAAKTAEFYSDDRNKNVQHQPNSFILHAHSFNMHNKKGLKIDSGKGTQGGESAYDDLLPKIQNTIIDDDTKGIYQVLTKKKLKPADNGQPFGDERSRQMLLAQQNGATFKQTNNALGSLLAKVQAIQVSETIRAMQGNVLIKPLMNQMLSKFPLQEIFYKGKGGEDSMFPGAPKDGGAQQLTNPTVEGFSKLLETVPNTKTGIKRVYDEVDDELEVEEMTAKDKFVSALQNLILLIDQQIDAVNDESLGTMDNLIDSPPDVKDRMLAKPRNYRRELEKLKARKKLTKKGYRGKDPDEKQVCDNKLKQLDTAITKFAEKIDEAYINYKLPARTAKKKDKTDD